MSLLQKQNTAEQSKLIKKYCIMSGVMSLGIMILVLLLHYNSLFLFGDATVLRMDLYHQYGPLYAELYDRITKGFSLVYSWTSGLGNSFLGNLFNYCCSPFALIMLIFGHKNMPEAIAVMITLKAVFSSVCFTYYINKSSGNIKRFSAAFGLLYTFTGYFVAYSWNIMWLDAMVVFPLVILGIERLIDSKKPVLYICALTYTMITNYYMAYMVCIISVLYFVFYYFSNYRLTDKLDPYLGTEDDAKAYDPFPEGLVVNDRTVAPENAVPVAIDETTPEITEINNTPEEYTEQIEIVRETLPVDKKTSKKHKKRLLNSRFFAAGVIFAFSSILAFLVSAFSLLPVAMCLTSSSATSAKNLPEEFKTYFNLFDFIANHLPSVEPTIRSSGDNVLPNVYSGLITVLLIPAYFFSDKIRGREKIMSVGLLGVFYLSFNLNVLNFIWHGFHYPNDLPYRFSFAYSFILITLAYKAILNVKEFSRKYFIATGMGLFAFIVLIDKLTSKNVDNYTIILSVIFTVAYVVIAGLISSDRFNLKTVETLLIFVIIVELCFSTSFDFVMTQSKSAYTSDYNTYQEIREKTEENESDLFYRTELTKLRARMDPSWYGYNGVSVFSSMAYEKTSNLMKSLGLFGNRINSYTYYPQTPVFNSFFSLKYLYDNSDLIGENNYYTFIESNEKFSSYKYNYYLPLAFSVSSEITNWNPSESGNPFNVQNSLVKNATGIDAVFEPVDATDVTVSNISAVDLSSVNNGATFTASKVTKSKTGTVTVTIDVGEPGQYYVYAGSTKLSDIKFSAGEDFSYSYASSSIQPFILDMGKRNEGEQITIEYTVAESNDSATLTFCAARLNEEVFIDVYDKIKENGTIELTEFKETELSGNITVANSDGFLFTSIPYDKSWKIYVDGELLSYSVEEEDDEGKIVAVGNGLIGFSLPKGEHTVTFKYDARGLKNGILISSAGVIICAILLLYKFIFKKKLAAKGKRAQFFIPIKEDVNNGKQ